MVRECSRNDTQVKTNTGTCALSFWRRTGREKEKERKSAFLRLYCAYWGYSTGREIVNVLVCMSAVSRRGPLGEQMKTQKHVRALRVTFVFCFFSFFFFLPPKGVLEVEVKDDAVLEDGDEQHDGEACEHAYVLQDKVSQLAALVSFTVAVQHLGQLFDKRRLTSARR